MKNIFEIMKEYDWKYLKIRKRTLKKPYSKTTRPRPIMTTRPRSWTQRMKPSKLMILQ